MLPGTLPSQGIPPPMQVSSQAMMAPPVMPPAHLAGQDASAAGPALTPGQAQQALSLKFDIGQILSVIRNNMSAAAPPQNVE